MTLCKNSRGIPDGAWTLAVLSSVLMFAVIVYGALCPVFSWPEPSGQVHSSAQWLVTTFAAAYWLRKRDDAQADTRVAVAKLGEDRAATDGHVP